MSIVWGALAGAFCFGVGSGLAILNAHLSGKRLQAERELDLRERELRWRERSGDGPG